MEHRIPRGVIVSCMLGLLACTDPAVVGVADDVRNPLVTAGELVMETGGASADDEADDDHDDSSEDAGYGSDCVEDDDCAVGHSCEDGVCVTESTAASCVEDRDCASGLSCEHGACIVETEDD